MTVALHPDFPVVSGRYRLTDEWEVMLPAAFNRRIEDGSLVLWRPGLTFWVRVWGPKAQATLEERMLAIRSRAHPQRTAEQIDRSAGLVRLTYELPEHDPARAVPDYTSISGYVFADEGHVQMSAYFDDAEARRLAYQVLHAVQPVAALPRGGPGAAGHHDRGA